MSNKYTCVDMSPLAAVAAQQSLSGEGVREGSTGQRVRRGEIEHHIAAAMMR